MSLLWPLLFLSAAACAAPVTVEIIPSMPVNVMKGGIGASMHCMEGGPGNCGGGSACGANPAPEDSAAWNSIFSHADWLGLDFCRVEVEQRMYEPALDSFSFDNPEMRVLYRWLDWCESRQVDVFFQQMWARLSWSASDSVRAAGLAALMDHLLRVRGYTCVKWLCINNEPVQWWDWQRPLQRGFEAVRRALDSRGLTDLPLSGPDDYSWNYSDADRDSMNPFLGGFDMHRYGITDFSRGSEVLIPEWTGYAHGKGKPFFMSELGSAWSGLPQEYPGTWDANMPVVKTIIGGLNMGVDGFNKWSLTNRGDMDGEWQLIDTWDGAADTLLGTFTPHPGAYYLFGLISRFTAPYSTVEQVAVDDHDLRTNAVEAACLRSPSGGRTLLICNPTDSAVELKAVFYRLGDTASFYRYSVNRAAHAAQSDVAVESDRVFSMAGGPVNEIIDTLLPQSLTVYSTAFLQRSDPGIGRTPACSACFQGTLTNLAQGKPVQASSVYEPYAAALANDGLPYTRWSSQFQDSQWIQVDLGSVIPYSAVMLHWDPAYALSYEIRESDNGTDWRTILRNDSGRGGAEWLDSLAGHGRYVRIFCVTRATQWGISLYEFAVLSDTDTGSAGASGHFGTGVKPVLALNAVPNPFNPEVRISLSNGLERGASLKVYDLSGRLVADLSGKVAGGRAIWNASGAASGMYMLSASKGNKVIRKKMIYSK